MTKEAVKMVLFVTRERTMDSHAISFFALRNSAEDKKDGGLFTRQAVAAY